MGRADADKDTGRWNADFVNTIESQIKEAARSLGFDACRIGEASKPSSAQAFEDWIEKGFHGDMHWIERNMEKRLDIKKVLSNAQSVVSVAISYSRLSHSPESPDERPTVARYARYNDYHNVLKPTLKTLSERIAELTRTEPKENLWYLDTGPILERDAAQKCGIGFVGKHTNLINRSLGNWFFIAEIISAASLEPDPPEPNRCGVCVRCIDSCPTNAIVAPFQLDARKCISYWTIEHRGSIPEWIRPAIGGRIFGCDDCLAACPWNRFAQEGALMRDAYRPDIAEDSPKEWLQLSDAEFRERFRGTPLFRTKRQGILRNVLIALGNTGSKNDLPDLELAQEDDDPVVAEAATWAISEMRRRHKTPE